jgi:cell division protein ZapE
MDLTHHYRQLTSQPGYLFDRAQANAVEKLQSLAMRLIAAPPPSNAWQARLAALVGHRPQTIDGLYLWGGVGRGKTWLMDLFFEQLPLAQKRRLHFHHFMQEVHGDLGRLRRGRDPLVRVAAHFAEQARVLCLDEFYVEDIGDAMILYKLLDALQCRGVTLVMTSNSPPDELYKHGLQRERFLPAIELLKGHCRVHNLDGDTDHRLRHLTKAAVYFTPVDDKSEEQLQARFMELAPHAGTEHLPLSIHRRQIPTRLCGHGVVWFDFHALCFGPRSNADYREIARRFHTVLVSGVPRMGEQHDDAAHRFIDLVDELYERSVKLIMSAEAAPDALYAGRRLSFEFRRTASRLQEMRSREYLASAHRA